MSENSVSKQVSSSQDDFVNPRGETHDLQIAHGYAEIEKGISEYYKQLAEDLRQIQAHRQWMFYLLFGVMSVFLCLPAVVSLYGPAPVKAGGMHHTHRPGSRWGKRLLPCCGIGSFGGDSHSDCHGAQPFSFPEGKTVHGKGGRRIAFEYAAKAIKRCLLGRSGLLRLSRFSFRKSINFQSRISGNQFICQGFLF